MNSLERTLTSISHKEPDRVPIGEHGIDHDHVSNILGRHTYWRNRKDSTIAIWEGRRDEVVESMKIDYAELIEKLEYDVIPVHLVPPKGFQFPDPPQKISDGTWQDSKGLIYKYSASNDSITRVSSLPPKENLTPEDIEVAINNIQFEESQFELIDYICSKFGKDHAIILRDFNIDNIALQLFGGDQAHQLMMPVLNPDAVRLACQYALTYNKKLIDLCRHRDLTILMYERDYGSNLGCMESPDVIRNIYMPFNTEFTQVVSNSGKIPFLHCCGRIWDILPDLIKAGFKGYQSVQQSAGMDLGKVKELYGSKLTLWAGIQCETLIVGALEDVEKEVKNSLRVCMPEGGFIFGSSNSVQYGASTDNYLHALDFVRKYGIY